MGSGRRKVARRGKSGNPLDWEAFLVKLPLIGTCLKGSLTWRGEPEEPVCQTLSGATEDSEKVSDEIPLSTTCSVSSHLTGYCKICSTRITQNKDLVELR